MSSIAVPSERAVAACGKPENAQRIEQLFEELMSVSEQIARQTGKLQDIKKVQCDAYKHCERKDPVSTLKWMKELVHDAKKWVEEGMAVASSQGLAKTIGVGGARALGLTLAAGTAYFSNSTLSDEDKYFDSKRNSELADLALKESYVQGDLYSLRKHLDRINSEILFLCGPVSVVDPRNIKPSGPSMRAL